MQCWPWQGSRSQDPAPPDSCTVHLGLADVVGSPGGTLTGAGHPLMSAGWMRAVRKHAKNLRIGEFSGLMLLVSAPFAAHRPARPALLPQRPC